MKILLYRFCMNLFLLLVILMAANPAMADWSVTVNWTHSTGPNLANEKVFLDNQEKCNVINSDPATCNFIVTDLNNQEVKIISYNSQGTESAPYVIGNLLAIPAPATGAVISIVIVP